MFKTIKSWWTNRNESERKDDWLFTLMLVGSLIGLIASFVLSVEAIQLAKDPDTTLPCSINALVNCATVGTHSSSAVFGFPNSFLGLMTFPVVAIIAVAGLMRVKFPRLFMFGLQVGIEVGVVFAAWMLYMSYAVIQVFCPWCLTVDAAMLLLLFAVTRYNIRHDNLYLKKSTSKTWKRFVEKDFDLLAVVVVTILVVFAVLIKYRDFFFA